MKAEDRNAFRIRRRRAGSAGIILSVAIVALASGCSPLENLYYMTRGGGEAQDAYRHTREYARADRPGLGILSEQIGADGLKLRRLLPNETLLPGDNYILYMNFTNLGLKPDELKALEKVAPYPYPFEFTTERDFLARSDHEGGFLYASFLHEGGVSCVLAVRVVDFFGPELAGGGRDTAKILRNCVHGSVEQALGPILARPPQDDWYTF